MSEYLKLNQLLTLEANLECPLRDLARLRILVVSNSTWEEVLPRYSRRYWLWHKLLLELGAHNHRQLCGGLLMLRHLKVFSGPEWL